MQQVPEEEFIVENQLLDEISKMRLLMQDYHLESKLTKIQQRKQIDACVSHFKEEAVGTGACQYPATQLLLDEITPTLSGVSVLQPNQIEINRTQNAANSSSIHCAVIPGQRNRRCAAKAVSNNAAAIDEVNNLLLHHHPHVLQLIGVSVEDSPHPSVVILTELADCSLADRIATNYLSVSTARDYAEQIALGLAYLHHADETKPAVVHCDLKPANILVFRDKVHKHIETLKIANFGSAHEMKSHPVCERDSYAATVSYLPPETYVEWKKCATDVNHKVPIAPTIDVFAFGVILLEMIAPKWYRANGADLISGIRACIAAHPDIQALLSRSRQSCVDDFASEIGECDDLVRLVKDCIMIDRKKRPQDGHALLRRLRPELYGTDASVNQVFEEADVEMVRPLTKQQRNDQNSRPPGRLAELVSIVAVELKAFEFEVTDITRLHRSLQKRMDCVFDNIALLAQGKDSRVFGRLSFNAKACAAVKASAVISSNDASPETLKTNEKRAALAVQNSNKATGQGGNVPNEVDRKI